MSNLTHRECCCSGGFMCVERQDKIRHSTCNGHTFLVRVGDHGGSTCTTCLHNLVTPHAPPLPLGQVWTTPFHSVHTYTQSLIQF